MLAALFTALLLFGALPVAAQSDTGEIDIVVTDAASKAPIVLARVILDGPVIANEFTGSDGRVRFTDVPSGIYRSRVFARGFNGVTSDSFEVVNGQAVTVNVVLAQQNTSLKIIGSVEVKSSATVSTTSIDENSAQRKLSNNLADALGQLSGVTVNTSSGDSDATQTVSLEGHDPSQTALTLDGIPLNVPGAAGDLRQIGTDLFTGASVRFGPQAGSLGGGVNFRSLDPTLSWRGALALSAGTNGKYNYALSESGSVGKLGLAYMHTFRQNTSLLDGLSYTDASGLDYMHNGDGSQTGNTLKLRYQLDQANTLSATYLASNNDGNYACAQFTGPLPCGIGPDNTHKGKFALYSITDNALIGNTSVQASLYGTSVTNVNDLLNRFINGAAAPTGTRSDSKSQGFVINAQLPARDRHTISLTATSSSSTTSLTPLVAQARPFTFGARTANYSSFTIDDSIRSSTKIRLNDSIGVSHASNAPTSLLGGVGITWQPTSADTWAASYNLGGVAAHAGRSGFLTDPGQLRFDCNGNVAYGSAPGDEPGASSSNSERVSYTHSGRRGLISTSVYRQVQNDVVLPAEVNATALASEGIFPPGYFGAVQFLHNSPAGCGAAPGTPFGPSNIYLSTPIGGVQRVYEGAQIAGFFTLGNLVIQPFYNIQVAKALSSDPRINNPYSIEPPGAQLPNIPLHRAGVTLDYRAPHSALEYLLAAHYTGSNNGQNLPANTIVDAGVNANLARGSLTFAVNNLFDSYAGIFSSSQYSVPYTALNGTQIGTIARPNMPRQISVTYNVKFGSGAAQLPQSTRALVGPGGEGRRGGRGRFLSPLPSAPPNDPFAVNQSTLCTKDNAAAAAPILDGLKTYVASIEAAKKGGVYPDTFAPPTISGIVVAYHGLKQTYALSIVLKDSSKLRGLFFCAQVHSADEASVAQHTLYVEPNGGVFFRPTINFMPSVGLYIARRAPQANTENFRLYKLPSSKPATPFELRTATSCSAEMKTTAQELLAELQAYFKSGKSPSGWKITAHAAKAGTYYALEAADIGAIPALIHCGHIGAASKADLTALGYDGADPPTLNYAPALGLYLVSRIGTGPRRGPGAPAPSPSPSPPPKR